MNKTIGNIFIAIPLILAFVCFGLGAFVFFTGDFPARLLPGLVLFFLGSICIALFSTASVIISLLLNNFNKFKMWFFPSFGYAFAIATILLGVIQIIYSNHSESYVAGHIICGLGLITACVATVAAGSVKFILIPQNSAQNSDYIPKDAFGKMTAGVMKLLPIIFASAAWIWTFILFGESANHTPNLVAGFVMMGISCICTSLVGLVWSVVNQICNTYKKAEKIIWPSITLIMGTLSLVIGLIIVIFNFTPALIAPGWVLIGLGLICYSISSKIILLALVWRNSYPYANRIPMIPIFTALICLFIAGFLFVGADCNTQLFIPARVMVGLGCICFCLFSIVSILESGTSNPRSL